MSRRDEWQKTIDARDHEQRGAAIRSATAASHAAVPMAALTGSEEWRVYQQMLQGAKETAEAELAGLMPLFLEPSVVTHEALLALKARAVILRERIETLGMAVELPQRIRTDAENARKWLEEEEWRNRAAS